MCCCVKINLGRLVKTVIGVCGHRKIKIIDFNAGSIFSTAWTCVSLIMCISTIDLVTFSAVPCHTVNRIHYFVIGTSCMVTLWMTLGGLPLWNGVTFPIKSQFSLIIIKSRVSAFTIFSPNLKTYWLKEMQMVLKPHYQIVNSHYYLIPATMSPWDHKWCLAHTH